MALIVSLAQFASALSQGGKLAGLDVGTKTIGLAICVGLVSVIRPRAVEPSAPMRSVESLLAGLRESTSG